MVLGDSDLLRGLEGNIQHGELRGEGLGTGVLQLEGQLVDRVGGVGWGDNAACPEGSPHQHRGVNRVRGEEAENIAFAPVVEGLEALSEV